MPVDYVDNSGQLNDNINVNGDGENDYLLSVAGMVKIIAVSNLMILKLIQFQLEHSENQNPEK